MNFCTMPRFTSAKSLAKMLLKPRFRQPHVQRHLAAFEALNGYARAALLALLAPPGGLAFARADAPANAHLAVAGAFVVADVIQFHVVHSLSL
jgi:hypothetical protein